MPKSRSPMTPQTRGSVVSMTPAQIERQDAQCHWLRLAIDAQTRRADMRLDLESLRLPRPMEREPCEH
jgi:hypothetical protein